MSDTPASREDRGNAGGTSAVRQPPRRKSEGGSPLHVFKPGQGTYVRWSTAVGAALLTLWGVSWLSDQIQLFAWGNNLVARTVVVIVLLVLAALGLFRALGQNERIVNFMIATEGEMKKVNWSSRQEVWGATKVVILTVLALALVLFVVDVGFMLLFNGIGVLRVNLLGSLFGGGGEAP